MKGFVCKVCGFVSLNGSAPDKCPVCGAPKQSFQLDANAIKEPVDPRNLNDLEKKHIPSIEIKRQCGLAGAGCIDVNIKIGEVLHVMEPKHFIVYIDIYLNDNFIARYRMSPEKLNPVLGVHLEATEGKILALEYCNIHGRWIAGAEIHSPSQNK